jgi:hypothetical protein
MKTKQHNFVKSLCVTHYDHFKNIHSSIAHPKNPILLQLLYNWRLSEDPPVTRLFLMVEQDYEDCPTKKWYMSSLQDEVSAILPVLPLILVGRPGEAAQAWFRPSHTLGTDGYCYDHNFDRIVPINTGSNLAAVDRLWDQSDGGFIDHAGLAAADDNSYDGMAIEFWEFALALESRSCILSDDSVSLGTQGIPSPQNRDGDDNSDIDTSESDKPGTNSSVRSSLTNITPQQSVHDSIANLLANASLDPMIRQAILSSQTAVDTARGKS